MPSHMVPFKLHVSADEVQELRQRKTQLDQKCEDILRETRTLEDHMDEQKKQHRDMLRRKPRDYLQTPNGAGRQNDFNKYMRELQSERMHWFNRLQNVNEELSSVVARLRDIGIMV